MSYGAGDGYRLDVLDIDRRIALARLAVIHRAARTWAGSREASYFIADRIDAEWRLDAIELAMRGEWIIGKRPHSPIFDGREDRGRAVRVRIAS